MRNKFCGFTPTPIYIVATRLKETSKTALAGFQNAQSKYKLVWGFTLVEILVVMAIIAALLSIFLAALGRSRQAAYRIACLNNLKQLGVAVEAYAQTYGFYPVCVPDVNERWSDFLADETIAAGKELGVPVSLWSFHRTAALYNCPILSRADCDISYCYNWLAGKVLDGSEVFAAVAPSYIPPGPVEPAEKKFHLLSSEKLKQPAIFVVLYDQPVKPVPVATDADYDSYKDIDPDDSVSDQSKPTGVGHLWHYKSSETVGPHTEGHDILFADGHVKWYKRWSGSEMGRNPQ